MHFGANSDGLLLFFFNDTATTEIYTLSLHDALPISYNQNRAFKVSTSGTLTVVAGNGHPGYAGDGVPGGASNALLNWPWGVAVDGSGNVYIADENNCVVRKVDTTNTITTIAGQAGLCGYN